jgi:hypothetical protein
MVEARLLLFTRVAYTTLLDPIQKAQVSTAGGERKRKFKNFIWWNGMEAISGSCIRGRVVAAVRVGRSQEAPSFRYEKWNTGSSCTFE